MGKEKKKKKETKKGKRKKKVRVRAALPRQFSGESKDVEKGIWPIG